MTFIKSSHFHTALIKSSFNSSVSDVEALALVVVLHSCKIRIHEGVVDDRITGFEPITTRHAAEVVASLFANDDVRSDYCFWYDKWNGDWDGYRILENVPSELSHQLTAIRDRLLMHPAVVDIDDDEWGLFRIDKY